MVDAIPGRDTEIRLSQHVILISHDITLFSLPYSAHTSRGTRYDSTETEMSIEWTWREGEGASRLCTSKEAMYKSIPEYEAGVGAPRHTKRPTMQGSMH